MEPAKNIIERLGGVSAVAEAIGVYRSTVNNWRLPASQGGTDGRVPAKQIPKLMELASEKGIEIAPGEFIWLPALSPSPQGEKE
jgi:transposase-like protein